MLTEQMPNFRGAALPYALDYVPGAWMNSIQVSKGTSTVKNGYESITGQIDIEYMKPNDTEQLNVNLYGNSLSRTETNFDANLHVNDRLTTVWLGHYDNDFGHHDDNDDGFHDTPNRRQWNLMNRWKYVSDRWIFHAGLSAIKERREGGQTEHSHSTHLYHHADRLYQTLVETNRYEAYMKNAFVLNPEHKTNIALMLSGSLQQQDADYDLLHYGLNQKNGYAQLMYETDITEHHNLSVGTSLNHDYLKESPNVERETTTGAYAQYTYIYNKVTAMAGLRADYSSRYHWFVTPRLHLKFTPDDVVSFRLSAGKGYRTVHPLAEMNYLLATSRQLTIDGALDQEAAWNYGASAALNIPVGDKVLKLNAEYYYTDFEHQVIADYETNSQQIRIVNLDGDSYSHTFQVDATYPLFEGFSLTAAYRLNDVKCTYNHRLMEKPLTSRYKGLVTATYKPGMGIWQFDATLQLNGGGRIIGDERFHSYEQLQAQVTREFRRFSVYVGGENLTNFRQKNPVRGYANPWGPDFDATLVWGPVHGRVIYAGLRFNLEY